MYAFLGKCLIYVNDFLKWKTWNQPQNNWKNQEKNWLELAP